MKKSKSILCLLLALMLLCGCEFGQYQEAVKPSHQISVPPVTFTDPPSQDAPFTVTLVYNGRPYEPSEPISVEWNDGVTLHSAPIGEGGVAKITGLDGDYRVTLTAVPKGYAYDPNINFASTGNRNITIQLHKLVETYGEGMELYDPIIATSVGVYCVEIADAKSEVFFQFAPRSSGVYRLNSWIDTTADEVNPIANYYGANVAFKPLLKTQDDGGPEGSYTKNFVMDMRIAQESISSTGGGAAAFTFGIRATHREAQYPIKVYFQIYHDGDYQIMHPVSQIIFPQETLVEQKEYGSGYKFVGPETALNEGSLMVFDADRFKLWPIDQGGDNYYHLYDLALYPETNGFGPILYAKISAPCRFLEMPFSAVEYQGNKALTLSGGKENYKLFIEGYQALSGNTGLPPYFCVSNCPCRENGTCTSNELLGMPGACETGCLNCHPDCRQLPREAIGTKGYANYCNSDGCYGVTEELRVFLQKYSINQLLFMDGDGFAETHPSYPVFATEEDQWLFACGYYIEK